MFRSFYFRSAHWAPSFRSNFVIIRRRTIRPRRIGLCGAFGETHMPGRAGVDSDAATFEVISICTESQFVINRVVRLFWMLNGLRFCRTTGLAVDISHVSPLLELTFRVYFVNFSRRKSSFDDYLMLDAKWALFPWLIFSTYFRALSAYSVQFCRGSLGISVELRHPVPHNFDCFVSLFALRAGVSEKTRCNWSTLRNFVDMNDRTMVAKCSSPAFKRNRPLELTRARTYVCS